MDELTTPTGSLAAAIAVLLLVLGYRLARPRRAREWAAVAAFAAALAVQLAGALGLGSGTVLAPRPVLRIAGAALLVAGLLVAGSPSRARRRAGQGAEQGKLPRPSVAPVYVGLAIVLVGQLARAPSVAGGIATGVAVAVCVAVSAARPAPA